MALPDPPQRSGAAPIPAGGTAPGGPPSGSALSNGQNRPTPVRPVPVARPNGTPAPQPVPQAAQPVAPPPMMPQPDVRMPVAPQPVAAPRPAVAPQPAPAPRPIPATPRPIPVPTSTADPTRIRLRRDEVQEEEEEEQLKRVARNAPPWLISCLFHLVLVVVLGLWYITNQGKFSGITLNAYSEDYGEQLIDNTSLEAIGELQADEAVITPDDLQKVEDPFAPDPSMAKVTLESAEASAVQLDKPSISIALAGREKGTKAMLLGKYGGTPDSEAAVARALAWLKLQQRKDGTWSLKGPYRSGAVNGRDIPESATAMALLAFQGAGHTHLKGEYKKQVADGMKALLKMQGSDGNFFQEGGSSNHWFYAHGQCTIAVCELYGMTKDQDLRKPAELAVKYCIDCQEPELGGWRYLPRSDSDTSVTGWIVMALQSARMAGLDVPSPVLEKIGGYLDKVTPDGSRYAYQVDMEPTLTMTAEALLCRQYLGWRRDEPRLLRGVEMVSQNLPHYDDRDVYYWYYGTQVMHHMEGKYWKMWNDALRDMLVSHQERTGLEKGSWDPLGENPDRWANLGQGGRLYTTCLSVYMLEVYYRHLPIYGVKR